MKPELTWFRFYHLQRSSRKYEFGFDLKIAAHLTWRHCEIQVLRAVAVIDRRCVFRCGRIGVVVGISSRKCLTCVATDWTCNRRSVVAGKRHLARNSR